jgi:hypothetical protein
MVAGLEGIVPATPTSVGFRTQRQGFQARHKAIQDDQMDFAITRQRCPAGSIVWAVEKADAEACRRRSRARVSLMSR